MRAIEGTQGEDIFKSISYEGLRFNATSEIVERIPEASYTPDETTETTNYIEIQEHWVLPEYYNSDEYKASVDEIFEFFDEIDYPIRVDTYKFKFGNARYAFVFNYNNRGEYHAKYSPKAMLSEYPEFQESVSKMISYLSDFENREWTFMPHLSFLPEE